MTTLPLWTGLGLRLGGVGFPIDCGLQEFSGICGVSDQSFQAQDKLFKYFLLNELHCQWPRKVCHYNPPSTNGTRDEETKMQKRPRLKTGQVSPEFWGLGLEVSGIKSSGCHHPAPSWRNCPWSGTGVGLWRIWPCGLLISTLLRLSRSHLFMFIFKCVY